MQPQPLTRRYYKAWRKQVKANPTKDAVRMRKHREGNKIYDEDLLPNANNETSSDSNIERQRQQRERDKNHEWDLSRSGMASLTAAKNIERQRKQRELHKSHDWDLCSTDNEPSAAKNIERTASGRAKKPPMCGRL